MKLYVFFVRVLLTLTPLTYFLKEAINIPGLKFTKDVLIILLGIIGVFRMLLLKKIKKTPLILFSFLISIVLVSSLNYSDSFFYAVSMREMVVYPIFYIVISLAVQDTDVDFNKFLWQGAVLCLVLMFAYLFLFKGSSFGLTGRFKAFFDREHLPAIFASLCVILTLNYTTDKLYRMILILASIILILITGTRSVSLFLILVYVMFEFKFSIKSILILSIVGIVIFGLFLLYFQRDVFYDLDARTNQYTLAYMSIKENFFFGIGVDKYGVLGDKTKTYFLNGFSTTSMDSSFLKYTVNLGVPLVLIYLSYMIKKVYKIYLGHLSYTIMVKRMLFFAIAMGILTGKFGAYPLNMIFFMNIVLQNREI